MPGIIDSTVQARTNALGVVIVNGQPALDLYIASNGYLTINEDPLIPASGFMVWIDSGALLNLIPVNNLDLDQQNFEPANSVIVYAGNRVWLSDFPLVVDSGIVIQLDSGSLLSMDQRIDDVYSGMSNSRPGNDIHAADFMAIDAYGPYVLDSGLLCSLEGAGNSVLNIQ